MGNLTLVTGGSGFLGQHLIRQLVDRGETVRALDIAPPAEPLADVQYARGSVVDRESVRQALRGVDRIYHLAARSGLWSRDKDAFRKVNLLGTRTVLEEARRAGVRRLVLTSSETVLRAGVRGSLGPYPLSKLQAQEEALEAAREGIPLVIVNPTALIGPGDVRLTPPSRMLLGFLNGEYRFYLKSTLNLIDVRDAALGHILAAERGRVGERYLLAGEDVETDILLRMLEEMTGLQMTRRRIPYWLALSAGAVNEFLADHVTHRTPAASVAAVRLTRAPMRLNGTRNARELGLSPRPTRESLHDALRWFAARGYLKRRPTRPLRTGEA
ncbi:MAG: NAD-dependent epimerase/dehydratase family protein [Gemmatimonadota bacterium]